MRGQGADECPACNGTGNGILIVQGACGGNRAEWFCAPKAAVTTRSVFMGPLWFALIMAACGNALTWTSEQGTQNGPDSTRHTPRARAGASRRAREQQAGARESRRARGRAGARESRAGAGARYPVLGGDDFSATTWPSSLFKSRRGAHSAYICRVHALRAGRVVRTVPLCSCASPISPWR